MRRNLTESFPNKDIDEIKKIEKRFYHFLIDTFLETCKMFTMSPEQMRERAKFIDTDIPNNMMHQGLSVSTYIGHYCNWEWISSSGLWLSKENLCLQIYHKLRNKYMDRYMLQLRERFGNKCVPMSETARYISHAKLEGKQLIIGFIADQSPKRRDSKYFIEFLNHNVPVITGTEKITKRYDYQALFLSAKRVRRGYYEYRFSVLHDNPSSLSDYELTRLYFQRLEQEILEQPEYYLWSHNRFKYAK